MSYVGLVLRAMVEMGQSVQVINTGVGIITMWA